MYYSFKILYHVNQCHVSEIIFIPTFGAKYISFNITYLYSINYCHCSIIRRFFFCFLKFKFNEIKSLNIL